MTTRQLEPVCVFHAGALPTPAPGGAGGATADAVPQAATRLPLTRCGHAGGAPRRPARAVVSRSADVPRRPSREGPRHVRTT